MKSDPVIHSWESYQPAQIAANVETCLDIRMIYTCIYMDNARNY